VSINRKGYTLIELIVVIVLIGLMISLATPRIRNTLFTDNLKTTTRRIMALLKNLRNEAVREQRDYFLHFDMDSNRLWYDSSSMSLEDRTQAATNASPLPEDVQILDIWQSGRGKKMTGEDVIIINRKGYTTQSVIHLGTKDDRAFTLVLSPFLRKIMIIERYIEFEGI
jgi:general secretion pathway protein H